MLKEKSINHLGLGRRDFKMLIFAFARLHAAGNLFRHAVLSSFGSLNRLEPFAKTSLHTLDTSETDLLAISWAQYQVNIYQVYAMCQVLRCVFYINRSSSRWLVITHSLKNFFYQEILNEHLLYVRHMPRSEGLAVNKAERLPLLVEFIVQQRREILDSNNKRRIGRREHMKQGGLTPRKGVYPETWRSHRNVPN